MNYTHYYFIGIGGIGMSAIARYFKSKGFEADTMKLSELAPVEKENFHCQ